MADATGWASDPEVLSFLREKNVAEIINAAVTELIKARPDDAKKFFAEHFSKPDAPTWTAEAVPEGGVLVCGHPGSPNSIPCMILGGKHAGDKYKFQMCDIMKGEQNSPDYLAMNPFHHIPTLKCHDGVAFFESVATMQNMAKAFAPDLYPEDKRLVIDMALCSRSTEIYPAWGKLGYYAMGIGAKPEPAMGATLDERLAQYAKAFLSGKFIGGDSVCIADYYLFPLINTLQLPTAEKLGYTLPERYQTYFKDVKEVLGDHYEAAHAVHNGWIAGNIDKVEKTEFEKFGGLPEGKGDWKAEAPPDGGFIMYNTAPSPNALPINIIGYKLMGDKFKYQECCIFPGKEEQMSADFLAINPFHHIPSGKFSDGQAAFESSSMIRQLARKYAPDLYPADKQRLIDCALEVWQYECCKKISPLQYHAMGFAPGAPPTKDAIKEFHETLATTEKKFLKDKFFVGDAITIADLMWVGRIHSIAKGPTADKMGYELPARWQKWHDDVKEWVGDDAWTKSCAGLDGLMAAKLADAVSAIEK